MDIFFPWIYNLQIETGNLSGVKVHLFPQLKANPDRRARVEVKTKTLWWKAPKSPEKWHSPHLRISISPSHFLHPPQVVCGYATAQCINKTCSRVCVGVFACVRAVPCKHFFFLQTLKRRVQNRDGLISQGWYEQSGFCCLCKVALSHVILLRRSLSIKA